MASPTLQGALKDGFGEAVVASDMPKSCKFLSLDRCQKRFLWAHKEVDLAPHPVVGLVLQEGNTEKFPHALCFKSLEPFFFSESAGDTLSPLQTGGLGIDLCAEIVHKKVEQTIGIIWQLYRRIMRK